MEVVHSVQALVTDVATDVETVSAVSAADVQVSSGLSFFSAAVEDANCILTKHF